jgi:hypothetical protein
MKKFIALFLVFSILLLSGNIYSKERKGAELYIQKKDGHYERGELIAVKKRSLLLKDYVSGVDVSVDIGDVRKITIMRESKLGKGAIWGGIIGAIPVSIAIVYDQSQPAPGDFGMYLPGLAVWIGGGALLGALIGLASGRDETIQIYGESDSEAQEVLDQLRKKARVRNFQ